jgi:SAM-dependent methyltransferase
MGNPENKTLIYQTQLNPSFAGKQQLIDSELGLIRYTTQIVAKFYKSLILENKTKGEILEFGAGTGFLAEIFRKKYNIVPICIEIDGDLITMIREKGFTCFNELNQNKFELKAIYSSNVLEHIEDDQKILKQFYKEIEKNGRIGIYVPAFQHLYSEMDRSINHVRRYSRKELISKVEAAGFTILSVHYDDFVGYFAATAVKMIGYKKAGNLGSLGSLKFYDTIIYPISRIIDKLGGKHIVGKNLILVGMKR